jgi:hypothetical protein
MYGISITGGNQVTQPAPYQLNVPKRDLITALQVAMQNGEFLIANGLKLGKVLEKEMLNFKVKISLSGHDSYEAWREKDHDDLVLSAAMAAWLAQQRFCRFN